MTTFAPTLTTASSASGEPGAACAPAKRPVILVAPRWQVMERTLEVPEQLAPEEVMASVFADAILAAGGLPLMMPLTDDDDVLETMLAMCDGVAVPGGQDVNPALWGDDSPYDESLLCGVRDAFELKLVRRVLELDKPLFATCRGMQLLNVALGGSLCMDVPGIAPLEGTGLWRHAMVLTDPAHPVDVEDGTLLARCIGGVGQIQANSSHHCCVDKMGEGVRLVARATDGIPEAIEVPSARFCLGVQWHPEYTWQRIATDFAIWRAFVDACR